MRKFISVIIKRNNRLPKGVPSKGNFLSFTNSTTRKFSKNNHQLIHTPTPQTKYPNFLNVILERIKRIKVATQVNFFIVFVIVVMGWMLNLWSKLYTFYSKATRAKRVMEALEELSEREQNQKIESGSYISRPKVEEDLLEKIFKLEERYGLVYGDHGVGKTTVIKYVIKKAREQGYSVFYFPVQEQGLFLESFSVALRGFDIIPKSGHMSAEHLVKDFLGLGAPMPASVSDLFPIITIAGTKLLQKTKKRPIIVIDDCNNMDTDTLIKMQNFAKEEADNNHVLVIFVSSEGVAPDALFTRSASSRITHYKVGELSREEADHFLEQISDIKDKKFRNQILDVTGYSFQYLTIAKNRDIDFIETHVTASIQGYLRAVKLLSWKSDKVMVSIIKKILEKNYIPLLEFTNMIEDSERADNLLKGNLFSVTPVKGGFVSFQNTATRNYFHKELANEMDTFSNKL